MRDACVQARLGHDRSAVRMTDTHRMVGERIERVAYARCVVAKARVG